MRRPAWARRARGRNRQIAAARRVEIARIAKLERKSEAYVVDELVRYSLRKIDRRRRGIELPAYVTIDIP